MPGVAIVGMRTYFSAYHIKAADHFAALARQVEDAHAGRSRFDVVHRAYVTSAVLSAVAFLEAAINELFDDVADDHPGCVDPLTLDSKRLLAGMWTERLERAEVMEKFRVALLCCGANPIDKGTQRYQDAVALVGLRNRLTHSRAETTQSDDAKQAELRRRWDARFAPNRLMTYSENPYFPDHLLGAGCSGISRSKSLVHLQMSFSLV